MLEGFNYPLTPKGKSTLNPLPPWYYSADFLEIEFWSDPGAVAALLPKGLDLDASANGHCNALFYDWQFSRDTEEYLDPARYQYREFFILVDALHEGKPVAYCPYIFVDNDAAMLADGLKAIRSVWARYSKPGITPRLERQVPPSHLGRSLPAPSRRRATARRRTGDVEGAGNQSVAVEAEAGRKPIALPASSGRYAEPAGTSRAGRECSARREDRAGLDRKRFSYATSLQR
jgi:hypothetical protein